MATSLQARLDGIQANDPAYTMIFTKQWTLEEAVEALLLLRGNRVTTKIAFFAHSDEGVNNLFAKQLLPMRKIDCVFICISHGERVISAASIQLFSI
jgi:hypothetical protein